MKTIARLLEYTTSRSQSVGAAHAVHVETLCCGCTRFLHKKHGSTNDNNRRNRRHGCAGSPTEQLQHLHTESIRDVNGSEARRSVGDVAMLDFKTADQRYVGRPRAILSSEKNLGSCTSGTLLKVVERRDVHVIGDVEIQDGISDL
jgi:hypothetical protein